jgi:hypothetical protein
MCKQCWSKASGRMINSKSHTRCTQGWPEVDGRGGQATSAWSFVFCFVLCALIGWRSVPRLSVSKDLALCERRRGEAHAASWYVEAVTVEVKHLVMSSRGNGCHYLELVHCSGDSGGGDGGGVWWWWCVVVVCGGAVACRCGSSR